MDEYNDLKRIIDKYESVVKGVEAQSLMQKFLAFHYKDLRRV